EEVLVGRVSGVGGDEDGVAVRRGPRHVLRGEEAARARLVVDDDRLLRVHGHLLSERARELVRGAPGSERHHEGDGLGGIVLREGGGRGERHGHEEPAHRHCSSPWSKDASDCGIVTVISRSRKASVLPWLSRLSELFTPPSSTSSITKFMAPS